MFAGITDWNICISKFLVRGRRGARPKAERFRPGRRPLKRGRLLAGACGACPGRAFGPARRPVRAAKSRPATVFAFLPGFISKHIDNLYPYMYNKYTPWGI